MGALMCCDTRGDKQLNRSITRASKDKQKDFPEKYYSNASVNE